MFYRNILKTFTQSRSSYLRTYNGVVNTFGNYRNVIPLSTTRLALKDDK